MKLKTTKTSTKNGKKSFGKSIKKTKLSAKNGKKKVKKIIKDSVSNDDSDGELNEKQQEVLSDDESMNENESDYDEERDDNGMENYVENENGNYGNGVDDEDEKMSDARFNGLVLAENSTQNLNELKNTESLFSTNLLKQQLEAFIKDVSLNGDEMKSIGKQVDKLIKDLKSLKSINEIKVTNFSLF